MNVPICLFLSRYLWIFYLSLYGGEVIKSACSSPRCCIIDSSSVNCVLQCLPKYHYCLCFFNPAFLSFIAVLAGFTPYSQSQRTRFQGDWRQTLTNVGDVNRITRPRQTSQRLRASKNITGDTLFIYAMPFLAFPQSLFAFAWAPFNQRIHVQLVTVDTLVRILKF